MAKTISPWPTISSNAIVSAWFVVDAVEEMDLDAFYADYRVDGHGAAAYEPSMMVALLLYAYATKQRSSRAIELHCRQDIAYRVINHAERAAPPCKAGVLEAGNISALSHWPRGLSPRDHP